MWQLVYIECTWKPENLTNYWSSAVKPLICSLAHLLGLTIFGIYFIWFDSRKAFNHRSSPCQLMLSINIVAVENQSVHNLSLITSQGPIITWLGVATVRLGLKYYVRARRIMFAWSILSAKSCHYEDFQHYQSVEISSLGWNKQWSLTVKWSSHCCVYLDSDSAKPLIRGIL